MAAQLVLVNIIEKVIPWDGQKILTDSDTGDTFGHQ